MASPPVAEPALRLDAVRKSFGGVPAVDTIFLDVQPGELLTLLGPSGCGKTTTLNLIAGFEQPDAGHIHLAGRAVERLPPFRCGCRRLVRGAPWSSAAASANGLPWLGRWSSALPCSCWMSRSATWT